MSKGRKYDLEALFRHGLNNFDASSDHKRWSKSQLVTQNNHMMANLRWGINHSQRWFWPRDCKSLLDNWFDIASVYFPDWQLPFENDIHACLWAFAIRFSYALPIRAPEEIETKMNYSARIQDVFFPRSRFHPAQYYIKWVGPPRV